MELQTTAATLRRAAKAYRHASRQLSEAKSERARLRHTRRQNNARRLLGEARHAFEVMAFETAPAD